MKCSNCGKAKLEAKIVDDRVEIDGGPSILVSGLSVQSCPECGHFLMNSVVVAERTRKALAGLLDHYAHNPSGLPGKVSLWMRKAVDLSASDLAGKAHLNPSTLSHAEKKNSFIDQFAAIVLLSHVADFVSGGTEASEALKAILELEQLIDASILESVEVIDNSNSGAA